MLLEWRAGDRSARARYCVEFQSHLPPEPEGGQAKGAEKSTSGEDTHCEGELRGGLRHQKEGGRGSLGGSRVRHRIGRQLQGRGYF